MDHFYYRDRVLHCEDVPVRKLAEAYGTPLYVYSKATLLHHLNQLKKAFAALNPLICYSLKTNPNLHIGRLMAENGTGFDVTSGGELYRALAAGGTGDKIVYAGVGKTDAELREGLDKGVFLFNVESEAELYTLADVAKAAGKTANVALRVNPDLPPKTHVKTDTSVKGVKFGFDIDTVLDIARGAVGNAHIKIVGLQTFHHSGRRHERPDPADALRLVPPNLARRTDGRCARSAGGLRGGHPEHQKTGRGRPGVRVE